MKINAIGTDYKQNFKAKVSDKFVNSMRGFVNSGENRLKNNYKLTQKLEEYASYGFDDYTVEMHQKYGAQGTEYRLFAVKDGDTSGKKIALTQKFGSYRKIFNVFMTFRKRDFVSIMESAVNK